MLPVSFLNRFGLHKDKADTHRPIPVSCSKDISNFVLFPRYIFKQTHNQTTQL